MNTTNLKFLTPLDALLESPPQSGDLVLGEMIRAAGGKTAAEVLFESEPVVSLRKQKEYLNSNKSREICLLKQLGILILKIFQ